MNDNQKNSFIKESLKSEKKIIKDDKRLTKIKGVYKKKELEFKKIDNKNKCWIFKYLVLKLIYLLWRNSNDIFLF